MFEPRKPYYSSRRTYYSKKKPPSFYGKHSGSKYKSKKHKGSLIELDDNFTYQHTEPTTTHSSNETISQEHHSEDIHSNIPCKEVAEFTLNPNQDKNTPNIDDNKENISDLANMQNSKSNQHYNETSLYKNVSSSSLSSSEKSFETSSQNVQINNNVTSSNSSTTQINLSNETIKEAYFFPKKLTNIYNYIYNQFQYQYQLYNNVNNHNQFYQGHHPQFRTTSNTNITSSYTSTLNATNTPQHNSYLRHNSISNTTSTLLVRSNSSVTSSSNSSCSIAPFSYYDTTTPPFSNQNGVNLSFGLNKINIPQVNNELSDKEKENTDVLSINLKISEKEILVFKIRRYDDMFQTVKIFCEINHLDQKFIRPLILNVIKAMNIIYGIVNMTLNEEEIKELKRIKEEAV